MIDKSKRIYYFLSNCRQIKSLMAPDSFPHVSIYQVILGSPDRHIDIQPSETTTANNQSSKIFYRFSLL